MELSDLLAPLDWGRQGLVNTGEGLSGLLGGDFSRQNFAKVMPGVAGLGAGLLTGGTMAGPAAALAMALTQGVGKQFNPEHMQAQTTQDLVTKLGGDPDSTWQNLGVGLATDPFTYAGLGMGSGLLKGAGAAGRAAEASKIASAASGLGDAESAVGGLAAGTRAVPGGRAGLRASMGLVAPAEAEQATGGGSKLAEMLGARRDIAKVHYDPSMGTMNVGAGRVPEMAEKAQIWGKLRDTWEPGLQGIQGSMPEKQPFVALLDDPGLAAGMARGTRRHEMYHGLIDNALQTGETGGLSPLQKATAYLRRTADPESQYSMRDALSVMLNETGAHAVQDSASPLSQALAGGKFLFGGRGGFARNHYLDMIASQSPTVGKAFQAMGYAPEVAQVAGLGGAGLGAYAVGRKLFGE